MVLLGDNFSALHRVASVVGGVSDVTQAERTTTVEITGEFGCEELVFTNRHRVKWALTDSRLGILSIVELDDTGSPGATTGLVLNLGALNLSDGVEELNEIIVASRPRKLIIQVRKGNSIHIPRGNLRCERK